MVTSEVHNGARFAVPFQLCLHFEDVQDRDLLLVTTFCTVYRHVMTVVVMVLQK